MSRLTLPCLLLLPLFAVGCIWDEPKIATVADNPFGRMLPSPEALRSPNTGAGIAAAARVDQIGRKIVAANKQIGLQPMFRTIGAPQAEIFHKGAGEIDVTEGLVKQCQTDGQLAAVLCQELAKMVVEREARTPPETRQPDPLPPMDVPVGNDGGGSFGPPDQLHRAELARFEAAHPRRFAPPALPDPQTLARAYLIKAGYPATDLEAAAAVLRSADGSQGLARQIISAPAPQH